MELWEFVCGDNEEVTSRLLTAANYPFSCFEIVSITLYERFPVDQCFFIHFHRFEHDRQFAAREDIAGACSQ